MWGCSVWSVCSTVCWLRMWRKISGLVSRREHQTEVVAVLEHLLQEHHQLRLCQGGLQAGVVQDQWLHRSSSHTESSGQRQVRPGWWNIFDTFIFRHVDLIDAEYNHFNNEAESFKCKCWNVFWVKCIHGMISHDNKKESCCSELFQFNFLRNWWQEVVRWLLWSRILLGEETMFQSILSLTHHTPTHHTTTPAHYDLPDQVPRMNQTVFLGRGLVFPRSRNFI